MKGEKVRQTRIYHTNDNIRQIKSTIVGNQAVLDAVYNEKTKKLTNYSKRYKVEDYLNNLDPVGRHGK